MRNNIDQRTAHRNKASDKNPNRQNGELNGGLESKIIELIKANPNITVQEISESINVSKRKAERIIKVLRDAGQIYREGSNRHGVWRIKE